MISACGKSKLYIHSIVFLHSKITVQYIVVLIVHQCLLHSCRPSALFSLCTVCFPGFALTFWTLDLGFGHSLRRSDLLIESWSYNCKYRRTNVDVEYLVFDVEFINVYWNTSIFHKLKYRITSLHCSIIQPPNPPSSQSGYNNKNFLIQFSLKVSESEAHA